MKNIVIFMILTAVVLFSGCGENETGTAEQNQESNVTEENILEEPAEQIQIYPELEAVDFGGYEFMFLARTIISADWAEWNHRDFFAEEITGDAINDAVYNRNRKIEEKYNITINEIVEEHGVFASRITRAVAAGDELYDAIGMHINQFAPLAQNGNLVDLFSIPNIDLKMPWWDQGTVRDLSIANRLFVVQGDLLIMDNDAMEAMIFNKELLRDHNLDDPYEIVKKGEWTFDKLIEMSRGVAADLNGDGSMYIRDDLFGYILQGDTANAFYVSGGEKIVSKDANDYPVITFGSERGYKITELLSEMLSDTENSVNLHSHENQFPIYDEQVKMMEENRALFSWLRMRIVERLRGMETDFGILPLPKLDSTQPDYITQNNPHTGAGIAVPVTAKILREQV
ncbi:MAG: extracellular solute-binding protein [Oscillospiraceae bacterium]|nr:extracellular solute-binding protein [Oscillospiraceae bacterium]